MPAQRHSVASPPYNSRAPQPCTSALNFEHPYLVSHHEQKKELGMFDLFFFKMFRCFVPDNLPPPDPNATVYQQNKRSSSTTTDSRLHLRAKRESNKSASTFSTISITREPALETFSVPTATKPQPRRVKSHSPAPAPATQSQSPNPQRPVSENLTRPNPNLATSSLPVTKSGRVSALSAMFEEDG